MSESEKETFESEGKEYEPPELEKFGSIEEMTKGMGQTGLDTNGKRESTGPPPMGM